MNGCSWTSSAASRTRTMTGTAASYSVPIRMNGDVPPSVSRTGMRNIQFRGAATIPARTAIPPRADGMRSQAMTAGRGRPIQTGRSPGSRWSRTMSDRKGSSMVTRRSAGAGDQQQEQYTGLCSVGISPERGIFRGWANGRFNGQDARLEVQCPMAGVDRVTTGGRERGSYFSLRTVCGSNDPLLPGRHEGALAVLGVQLLVNVLDVRMDRVGADAELCGDVLVGQAVLDLLHDLAFPVAQDILLVHALVLEFPDHLARDLGAHGRAAARQGVERVDELARGAPFQDVGRGTGLDRREHGLPVVEDGVGHDLELRQLVLDLVDELDPRHAGQTDVRQQDLGPGALQARKGVLGRGIGG